MALVRVTIAAFFLPLAMAGCGAAEPQVQSASASASASVFRGGQSEVRFRCGSESLRARLRQGNVQVQLGSGETKTLVPVDDPRAQSGRAFGDGRLTLFKVGDTEDWMLARSDGSGATSCQRDSRPG